MKEREEEN